MTTGIPGAPAAEKPSTTGRPPEKLVLAIADDLPAGLALNAAALLGVSLGRMFPEIVGPDVVDSSGTTHPGISTRALPVLAAPPQRLAELAGKARAAEQVTTVDVTDVAQSSRSYAEYTRRLADLPTEGPRLAGLAVYGPTATVVSLTGDLPLFR